MSITAMYRGRRWTVVVHDLVAAEGHGLTFDEAYQDALTHVEWKRALFGWHHAKRDNGPPARYIEGGG